MQVRVKLMGVFKEKTPDGGLIELPEGATIEKALAELKIPVERVHTVLVNSAMDRDLKRQLNADDELTVLAPVGGGGDIGRCGDVAI